MIEPGVVQLRIFAALFLVLALGALAAFVWRRRRVARALGDSDILARLLGLDLESPPWRRLLAVGIAAVAIAIALLDPALAATGGMRRGPLVLVLDASGSMLAGDAEPTRLEVQRDIARSLVAELPDVPIGLVAFAGRAFSLTPPTHDRAALEMYLASLDPSIVTQSGSALGAAIRQGIGLLGDADRQVGGTLVLIGDGDETQDADAALDAAALTDENGARLHTVAIGTPAGAPVPALDLTTGTVQGYLREPGGELLVSRVDEELLRSLARRGGGGVSVSAEDPAAVDRLVTAIQGAARPPEPADGRFPRYAWLAAAALLILLLEPLAAAGRRPA